MVFQVSKSNMTVGEQLINEIKNGIITKDHRSNSGRDFHAGYEELYRYKFKKYLSSVGRYIQNQKIKEVPYYGE